MFLSPLGFCSFPCICGLQSLAWCLAHNWCSVNMCCTIGFQTRTIRACHVGLYRSRVSVVFFAVSRCAVAVTDARLRSRERLDNLSSWDQPWGCGLGAGCTEILPAHAHLPETQPAHGKALGQLYAAQGPPSSHQLGPSAQGRPSQLPRPAHALGVMVGRFRTIEKPSQATAPGSILATILEATLLNKKIFFQVGLSLFLISSHVLDRC